MSNKVGYSASASEVDMSDYFPAYEVEVIDYETLLVNSEPTITLTRNRSGTTNYVSFIQPYFVGYNGKTVYNQFNLSDYVQTISIRSKRPRVIDYLWVPV